MSFWNLLHSDPPTRDAEEASSPAPEDPEPTPEPAAESRRPSTRSTLQLPTNYRFPSPQSRLRNRFAKTPSPSPTSHTDVFFESTTTSTMDAAAVKALVEATVKAATENAVAAALEAVRLSQPAPALPSTAVQPSDFRLIPRKVDLPAMDKSNIEIWIRRVESAFTRAGISTAKDKFAQMESKFGVDSDPIINDYLYGTHLTTTGQRSLGIFATSMDARVARRQNSPFQELQGMVEDRRLTTPISWKKSAKPPSTT